MDILTQLEASVLSRKGQKNTTGKFEGTPSNVALVRQGVTTPQPSQAIPAIQNPVDVVSNTLSNTTYLEYLQSAKRL